jgi:hypothetical protein
MRSSRARPGLARPGRGPPSRRRAALALLLASLCGCAEINRRLEPPPVNPSSPIAALAERTSQKTFVRPSFKDVPPKWTDAPAPAVVKAEVVREIADRRALEAYWAVHGPYASGTEAYAKAQEEKIPPGQRTPVAAAHDVQSQAFAREKTKEATKPQ